MMRFFPGLLFVLAALPVSAAEVEGSAEADRLVGTTGADVFLGGAGPDTFVIDGLSAVDSIRDFRPEEGDHIEIRPYLEPLQQFRDARFQVNRRGVVSFKLQDGTTTPIVRTGRSDLKLVVDKKEKRVLLRFEAKF